MFTKLTLRNGGFFIGGENNMTIVENDRVTEAAAVIGGTMILPNAGINGHDIGVSSNGSSTAIIEGEHTNGVIDRQRASELAPILRKLGGIFGGAENELEAMMNVLSNLTDQELHALLGSKPQQKHNL